MMDSDSLDNNALHAGNRGQVAIFFIENGDSIFKYFIDGLFFTFGGKVIF